MKDKRSREEKALGNTSEAISKMEAFLELEKMLIPASQELDYDKELAEARDEKYGYTD